jgi:ABC-type proline/glycine betaine transport system permease subunit
MASKRDFTILSGTEEDCMSIYGYESSVYEIVVYGGLPSGLLALWEEKALQKLYQALTK